MIPYGANCVQCLYVVIFFVSGHNTWLDVVSVNDGIVLRVVRGVRKPFMYLVYK